MEISHAECTIRVEVDSRAEVDQLLALGEQHTGLQATVTGGYTTMVRQPGGGTTFTPGGQGVMQYSVHLQCTDEITAVLAVLAAVGQAATT